LREVVLAKPGETLQTVYRAKNLSDQPVVAKARHVDRPEEYLAFLSIVQCFCFIQQTLQPGEEAELPLVFRVEWDVPLEVRDFYVHYEFYPIESFPEEE
jgi:cytochrome c oxidase assembly protein subunit 11